jgi:hypothetical protein
MNLSEAEKERRAIELMNLVGIPIRSPGWTSTRTSIPAACASA